MGKFFSRAESLEFRKTMLLYAEDILKSEGFLSSAKNIQHGNISVMKHCLKVAYASLWINRHWNCKCNERELVRGALLHDYFLYDWHSPEHCGIWHLHGYFHPGIALRNATRDFELTKREKDTIKKHMWPLTVVPPKYREGWVVTCADKYISTLESLRLQQRQVISNSENGR